tara:strand:- start:1451 stop:2305 length:855 start_codon:yes stop_codon:yes gene_type:complete
MDPNLRIYKALNKKRRENLKLDEKIWKFLLSIDDNDFTLRKGSDKYSVYSNKVNKEKYPNLDWPLSELNDHLKSFTSEIRRANLLQYFESEDNQYQVINPQILKKHINNYLNCPQEVKIHLCTDPGKQQVHEKEQVIMINEFLTAEYFCHKFPSSGNGSKYLDHGEISDIKGRSRCKNIDCVVIQKNFSLDNFKKSEKIFLGTLKYIFEAGGAQDSQWNDVKGFLKESNDYCDSKDDNVYFYAQLDGKWANDRTKKLSNIIKNDKRIFAGNSLEVIEWINKNIQ